MQGTVAGRGFGGTAIGDAVPEMGFGAAHNENRTQHGLAALAEPMIGIADPAARLDSQSITGRGLLAGSAFSMTGGTEGGGSAAVWGRGALSRFDGWDGDMALDGEVTTATLAADYAAGSWIAGLSLSHSEGDGSYRKDGRAGEFDASLTGFYPYAGYDLTDQLSLWAVVGYGKGELTLSLADGAEPIHTDIDMTMAASGARGDLVSRTGAEGPALALEADVLFARTSSEAAADLTAANADVSRLRLGLEGSYALAFDSGATLTPTVELGVRHDGGDAETGFGVDIGGGLVFADPGSGLSVEVSARALLTHEASDFRDWGVSGALRFDPDPSSERGLSLSLTQSLGASAAGGVDALLGRETMAGLAAPGGASSGGRLDADAGYGFPVFGGRFTGTPYLGLGTSAGGNDQRLGWRLTPERRDRLYIALALEGLRRVAANGDAPEHGIVLRFTARW